MTFSKYYHAGAAARQLVVTGLAALLTVLSWGCGDNDMQLRPDPAGEHCATMAMASFAPAPHKENNEIVLDDLHKAALDARHQNAALRNRSWLIRYFVHGASFDESIIPAKFPVYFDLDSTKASVEGLWRFDILSADSMRLRFSCIPCNTIEKKGATPASGSTATTLDLRLGLNGQIEQGDIHLKLAPRKITFQGFEGKSYFAQVVASSTFLTGVEEKLEITSENQLVRFRFRDPSAFVAEDFLARLGIAMVAQEQYDHLDGIQKSLDSVEAAIDLLEPKVNEAQLQLEETKKRLPMVDGTSKPDPAFKSQPASDLEQQLQKLLTKHAELQVLSNSFLPKHVVVERAAPCK